MTGLELALGAGVSAVVLTFLNRALKRTAQEVGEDLVACYRESKVRNLIAVVEEAAKVHEKNGTAPVETPLRVLEPILEGASLEDDLELRKCWAGLLAAATSGADNVLPSYAQILRCLRPLDVYLLNFMITIKPLTMIRRTAFSVSNRDLESSVDNLVGLGLAVREGRPELEECEGDLIDKRVAMLTGLGQRFARACKGESDPTPRAQVPDPNSDSAE